MPLRKKKNRKKTKRSEDTSESDNMDLDPIGSSRKEYIVPTDIVRDWGNCPLDILMLIFERLDILSLSTCMFVNKYWKEAAEYNCHHFRLWQEVAEVNIPEKGSAYKEKSKLPWQYLFINFFLWRQVKNANVTLQHCYNIKQAKRVQIYQDYMIVTSPTNVEFFNLLDRQSTKVVENISIAYEESQFFAVNFFLSKEDKKYSYSLTLLIKHRHEDCQCVHNEKIDLNAVAMFKLYRNSCYVLDLNNTLWNYTTDNGVLFIKTGPKCYGNRTNVLAIHVHEDMVFIVMKGGDVFCISGSQFRRVFNILLPSYNYKQVPFLFYKGSAAYSVPNFDRFEIYEIDPFSTVVLAVPRLSALAEHADVVFLGYDDGKVGVHSLRKLLSCMKEPEKEFYLQDIVNDEEPSYSVKGIDVFEDYNKHHLIVTTAHNIYQIVVTLDWEANNPVACLMTQPPSPVGVR